MSDYRYLIVGGGLTGDAACKGIRSVDADGSIGLIGDEPDPPYARPPLSKGLWLGKDESSIWRGTDEQGVDLLLGREAVALDLDSRTVTDDRGATHGYEKLLLATGGRPREIPDAPDGVVYYRTVADYRAVRAAAKEGTLGRGRRRRVHRLRAGRIAGGERLCRDHGLSGRCDRRADLPPGPRAAS